MLLMKVNCEVAFCLPVSNINLIHGDFPQEIAVTGYLGETDAVLWSTDLTHEFDKA